MRDVKFGSSGINETKFLQSFYYYLKKKLRGIKHHLIYKSPDFKDPEKTKALIYSHSALETNTKYAPILKIHVLCLYKNNLITYNWHLSLCFLF